MFYMLQKTFQQIHSPSTMKLFNTALFATLMLPFGLMSQSLPEPANRLGILVMAGGRFDDIRKCVASPVGTKGGPIADVMLTYALRINERKTIRLNLPVMRPLLFALAFKSLQFEPEFHLLTTATGKPEKRFQIIPGIGLSLNYINEYDNPADEPRYFSIGPIFSIQSALALSQQKTRTLGLRAFYSPLFSAGDGRNGTVAGLTLLYWIGI